MKKILLLFLTLSLFLTSFSQKSLEFHFDHARALLAQRQIDAAIISLQQVYIEEPENSNINFLLGAAYTELIGKEEEAIYHLKKALQNVNVEYKVGSFEEKAAPIHLYYYLAVALVEQDKCAEANRAFEKLKTYSNKIDQYYLDEVDRHLQKCPFKATDLGEGWDKIESKPIVYEKQELVAPVLEPIDSVYLEKRGLLTEKIEYTTNAPLYGVQIGSNKNPSPTSTFRTVKNVDVFIDSVGIIRYVVGHFSYRKQAENLLKSIKEQGFTDAFVVNVNDAKKYSSEVISYQNINLRSGIRGEVEYHVQLGSFTDTIPADMLEIYFKIDGISEYKKENRTIMSIGPYEGYKLAQYHKKEAMQKGVKDAFIVAYNRGKKIPLKEAIDYTESKIEEE